MSAFFSGIFARFEKAGTGRKMFQKKFGNRFRIFQRTFWKLSRDLPENIWK